MQRMPYGMLMWWSGWVLPHCQYSSNAAQYHALLLKAYSMSFTTKD